MQAPAEEPNFAGEPALDADEIWALDDEPNADYMWIILLITKIVPTNN